MTFRQDLQGRVHALVTGAWEDVPLAQVSPDPAGLTLMNTGKHLNACFMYADIHRSTELVDTVNEKMAAEYYKAFLHCAAQIIRRNGGSIEAYDGDRVMAVFVGQNKEELGLVAALELHFAVREIINPAFEGYQQYHRPLRHTVGIDSGRVLVAKAGVRNSNDLVWIGAPANYAAKLNSFAGLDPEFPTRITVAAHANLPAKWHHIFEGPYDNLARHHYRSSWHMRVD